uniref:Uncharacterized protein n=1 Tax=Knipowitschia caucasica TaxID=637954 RepID=A0AAV2K0R0_KNICA
MDQMSAEESLRSTAEQEKKCSLENEECGASELVKRELEEKNKWNEIKLNLDLFKRSPHLLSQTPLHASTATHPQPLRRVSAPPGKSGVWRQDVFGAYLQRLSESVSERGLCSGAEGEGCFVP